MRARATILLTVLMIQTASQAAPAINPSEVQVPERQSQTSQLLTVGANSGRQLEFKVVGHKMMDINFSENDVAASIHIGKRHWTLAPKKKGGNSFTVEIPEEAASLEGSELKLRLKVPAKKNAAPEALTP